VEGVHCAAVHVHTPRRLACGSAAHHSGYCITKDLRIATLPTCHTPTLLPIQSHAQPLPQQG
jgi:hypothetical protein